MNRSLVLATASLATLAAATPAAAQSAKASTSVSPYIELDQTVLAQLSGPSSGDDVTTYTSVAAGVDAAIATRRAQGEVSLRYEHQFSETGGYSDSDYLTGLGRAQYQLTPSLSLEGGALATRARSDIRGGSPIVLRGDDNNTSDVYSLYAGPSFSTQAGVVNVGASAYYGWTKVTTPDGDIGLLPGQPRLDYFDTSHSWVAQASAGVSPGTVLPVGLTLSGAVERDEANQLKARDDQAYVRGDALWPVSRTVALTAGVGYQKIKTSSRDPLVDANGDPVLDNHGRFRTDPNSPRRIAYETDGLIYDAGVVWKPNERTELTATVAHQYGDTSYTGSLSWRWRRNVSLQVGVYDGIETFGRQLREGLRQLPTSFVGQRDMFAQQFNGCVFGGNAGSGSAGGCLNDVFQSISTASYRARGIDAILVATAGLTTYGVGAGYANRHLYSPRRAPGIQLIGLNDESWYAQAFWSRELDRVSGVDANLYLNWYDSGFADSPTVFGGGASGTYYRNFGRLGTTATLGVYTFSQDGSQDEWTAQALLGARYQF